MRSHNSSNLPPGVVVQASGIADDGAIEIHLPPVRFAKVKERGTWESIVPAFLALTATVAFGVIPTWMGFGIARSNTMAGAEKLGVAALQQVVGQLEPGSDEHIAAVMACVFLGVCASGFTTGTLHGSANAGLQLVLTAAEEFAQMVADCAIPGRNGRAKRNELEQELKKLQGALADIRKSMAEPQTAAQWQSRWTSAREHEAHIAAVNKDLLNIAIISLPSLFSSFYDVLETPLFPLVLGILTTWGFHSKAPNLVQATKYSSTIAAGATTLLCMLMAVEVKRRAKGKSMFTTRLATNATALHTGMVTQLRARFWAGLSSAVSGAKSAGPAAAVRGITLLRTHDPARYDTDEMRTLQLGLQMVALWNLAMMWAPERRIPVTTTPQYAALIADFNNKEVGADTKRHLTAEQVQALILAPPSAERDKAEEQLASLAREFYNESRAAIGDQVARHSHCASMPSRWKIMQELYHGAVGALGVGLGAFGGAAVLDPMDLQDPGVYWNPGSRHLMVTAMWTMGVGMLCLWAAKELLARPHHGPGSATPRPPTEVERAVQQQGLEPASFDNQTRAQIVFFGGLLAGAAVERRMETPEGAMASFLTAMAMYSLLQGFTRIAEGSRDTWGYLTDSLKARNRMMDPAPKVYPAPERFHPDAPAADVPDMHAATRELAGAIEENTRTTVEAAHAQNRVLRWMHKETQDALAMLAIAQRVFNTGDGLMSPGAADSEREHESFEGSGRHPQEDRSLHAAGIRRRPPRAETGLLASRFEMGAHGDSQREREAPYLSVRRWDTKYSEDSGERTPFVARESHRPSMMGDDVTTMESSWRASALVPTMQGQPATATPLRNMRDQPEPLFTRLRPDASRSELPATPLNSPRVAPDPGSPRSVVSESHREGPQPDSAATNVDS